VELLKRQVHTTDRAERQRMVHRAQELYAEELPAITLYHPQWYWAHDGRVDLYHTPGGMALGIPLPLIKRSFVRTNRP
jgi:peptide/nickel transport system substrate-binding protein